MAGREARRDRAHRAQGQRARGAARVGQGSGWSRRGRAPGHEEPTTRPTVPACARARHPDRITARARCRRNLPRGPDLQSQDREDNPGAKDAARVVRSPQAARGDRPSGKNDALDARRLGCSSREQVTDMRLPGRYSERAHDPTHHPRRHGRLLRVRRAARRPDLRGQPVAVGGRPSHAASSPPPATRRALRRPLRHAMARAVGCVPSWSIVSPGFLEVSRGLAQVFAIFRG